MQLCFSIRGNCTCSMETTASVYFVCISSYEVCSTQTHISSDPFRGIVEETPNTTEHGRPSVMLEKYASATKMQPQSSGSLRSNAGIEKGKEIAARLNIHRIHSQLRGLDSTGQIGMEVPVLCCSYTFCFWQKSGTSGVLLCRNTFLCLFLKCTFYIFSLLCSDIGMCAITAIPFEKSKVLFGLEELEEFSVVDETDPQTTSDLGRIAFLEKWGWIMFECGIENLTVKGLKSQSA